ncbi:MAG: hypothetical protein R2827_02820 [Bdellovibrionales bacterium]
MQSVISAKPVEAETLATDETIISEWSGIVKVENGQVITDISLPFAQVPLLTAQSNMYFRILPLDERKLAQNKQLAVSLARQQLNSEDYEQFVQALGNNESLEETKEHSDVLKSSLVRVDKNSHLMSIQELIDRNADKNIALRFTPYHAPVVLRGTDPNLKTHRF